VRQFELHPEIFNTQVKKIFFLKNINFFYYHEHACGKVSGLPDTVHLFNHRFVKTSGN